MTAPVAGVGLVGIGTDICDIRRIRATFERRGLRFVQRVLGAEEQGVFAARSARSAPRAWSYLATRFAAKEAFSKAIGLGLRSPMAWRDCQILNEPGGRPVVRLSGALALWFEARGWQAHVSVSDAVDTATAFVVVERCR